ncbi:MogA/MoaB family molybdenum cofactor biosynthesis protein [Candidatus Nitronereus thalassa]|uniref:Molybdenum cofactor biosynthesis protein B n=1 Tax=Candidatus Nitronereus thalassa TaxID=3020898 RepID=A0ABU3KBY6_9BACT|nr:MogA/MoaB family molybdenum cofactor biosynthesis protein [Candidatus Nitronereus thalassa]MDT7043941.1 MogA/MoaB family molybdenum cofactor biosynthesis protein [Candidatus Nitronereus thalassa]
MGTQHGSHSHGPSHSQGSASSAEHKARGPSTISCGIITCSDTRTPDTDKSGQLIRELLTSQGHCIDAYHVVKDEPTEVQLLLQELGTHHSLGAIIINGGTGISQRDSTFEAVDGLLEKHLVGFGEIFRYLSYKDIGSSAILSRATAGLYRGKVIFSIPGSSGAVRLAMESLIIPELPHIVGEMQK